MLPPYFTEQDIDLNELIELCNQETKLADYPFAAGSSLETLMEQLAALQKRQAS